MSNLSELLPAGGGGKQVDFVASGILPNGQAVVLKSNGQVEAVGVGVLSTSIPAGGEFNFTTDSDYVFSIAFDPYNANKFILIYNNNANQRRGTLVIGIVSGVSISFGSAALFTSTAQNDNASYQIAFDPNTENRFAFAYQASENNYYGQVIVGTVSGTSITFGTAVVFESSLSYYTSLAFNPNAANTILVGFTANGSATAGRVIVGTLSGTSVSFGNAYEYTPSAIGAYFPTIAFDTATAANKFVIVFADRNSDRHGYAILGTVSGTQVSFAARVAFNTANSSNMVIAFDPQTNGKGVVVYKNNGNSQYGTSKVVSISSNTLSFGSAAVFNSGVTYYNVVACDPNTAGRAVVVYTDGGNSQYGTAIVGQISGTSISYGSEITYNAANARTSSLAFDTSTSGKFVVPYKDIGNSNKGTAIVGQLTASSTNLTSTNFIGISDAAVASGATGSVTVKGGVVAGLAGGTFAVTVANAGSGNRYYINGVLQQTLNLREGFTYKFDQSASSNSGHPFKFSTTSNGTHSGGSAYTSGVTTSGTAGNAGAYTQIVVAANAPTLYYYCTNHSLMGGTANTLAAFVPNSVYYVQADGAISTVSTSPAVNIGKAISATSLILKG